MKVYTIICNFAIEDYDEPDQLWVANYKSREDALAAFKFKLKETDALDKDGFVLVETNEKWTVERLFNDLITNGTRYMQGSGSERNCWYVRGEELQEKMNEETISWN